MKVHERLKPLAQEYAVGDSGHKKAPGGAPGAFNNQSDTVELLKRDTAHVLARRGVLVSPTVVVTSGAIRRLVESHIDVAVTAFKFDVKFVKLQPDN
jgi:hypothetical protein